jgi:hypothetical protein
MKEAKTSPEFRGYCTQCKCGFSLSRGSKVECGKGHQLASNFPYDSFWNYCCGCDSFYPSNGLEGIEAEANCLHCDRLINRRFFCDRCNVITLEAGDESRRRPVEFSEDGYPFPSCPGCLLPAVATNLFIHDCYPLWATFLTERPVCPFCNEKITKPARVDQNSEEVVAAVGATKPKSSFAFFESFAQQDVSFPNWRRYLPRSRRGWLEFAAVVGFIFTTISLLVGLVPAVPAAIAWHFNKALKNPLIVSSIECPAHFVLAGERLHLKAQAKAPFENVRFQWTTTAGDLINHKEQNGQSEVELDTAAISVPSVPREVSVGLTVIDEYGETVHRHERITVIPRRLANNPPVLKIPPRCNCTLQEVVAGESVSLYAMAEDENEGEVLNYEWQSSSPSAQLIPITAGAGSSVMLNTSGVNPRAAPVRSI